jgi:hypothetical protein
VAAAPSFTLNFTCVATEAFSGGWRGRGIPARRAGATHVTGAFGAEDGWGNPATGPEELWQHNRIARMVLTELPAFAKAPAGPP